jgi:integrase/recombinase XerC
VQLLLHGKGRKLRVVPVGDHLAAATAGEVGWLFPGDDDGHLSPPYGGKLVVAALPDHRTAHTLRQGFAYRGSRNLRVVQTLLGHSSVATTERRTAVDDEAAMLAAQVCASATTRAHVFAQ